MRPVGSIAVALVAVLACAGCAKDGAPDPVDPTAPPDPVAPVAWPTSYEGFPKRPGDAPTFTGDIAPLVYEHCSPCHRPGGAAPFDLVTYDDVRRRGTEIATVTKMRYMPPWLPARGYARFEGERSLTVEQVGLIQQWIFEGMPQGDSARTPPPPDWPQGWHQGEPDLVMTLPRAYTLPAGGADVYRNFVIPAVLEDTRFVRGYEFRADNPRVVHHATIEVDRTRSARRLDAEDPEPGFSGMRAKGAHMPDGHFVAWVPGRRPTMLPDGMSWRLDEKTDVVMQLHMLPSGKEEPVVAELGLYLTDDPPTVVPQMIRLGRRVLDIPAGADDYAIVDAYRLPVDVDVLAVAPHAHYLGKDLQGFATLPDGSKRWLIRIPDWDFNWQDEFRFVRPVSLPAGTVLGMRFVYDNSAANVRNPHDPPVRVSFGPSTYDEMGDLWIQVLPRDPRESPALAEHYARYDRARSIARFRTLIARTPDDFRMHNELGHALMRAGNVDEAVSAFREALRLEPDYLLGRRNLGVALFNLGAFDEAIEHLDYALRAEPDDAETCANLALALAAAGRSEEAQSTFERAIALRPASPDTHFQLARLHESSGAPVDAFRHYGIALDQQRDWLLPMVRLAWLAATEPALLAPDEAVRLAERADELTGHADPVVLETLALAYGSAGRYDEAARTAELALALVAGTPLAQRAPRLQAAVQHYRSGKPFRP